MKYLYLDTSFLNKISNNNDKSIAIFIKSAVKDLLINKGYVLVISDTHLQEIYDREDVLNIKQTIDFLCKYKSIRTCSTQRIIDFDIQNALEIFFDRQKTMPRFITYLHEAADSNVDEVIKNKEKGKERKKEVSKIFNVEREKGIQRASELDKNQKRSHVLTTLENNIAKIVHLFIKRNEQYIKFLFANGNFIKKEIFADFIRFVMSRGDLLLTIKITHLMTCQLVSDGSWKANHNDWEDIEHMHFLPYVDYFLPDKNALKRLTSIKNTYSLDIDLTRVPKDLISLIGSISLN